MPFAQFDDQSILDAMFGNTIGKVKTAISAAATAQSTGVPAAGTYASNGTTTTWDTINSGSSGTPAATTQYFVGTPKGRFVPDGVLNGTTTVTSATANFVTTPVTDVGLTITGPGIPSGTTISSVTNATTIVLSAAATVTASNVNLVINGAAINQYTAPHMFLATAVVASPASLTVASQSIGLAIATGDIIINMGTGAAPNPAFLNNALFIGLSTQITDGSTDTQANILSGEPTATGTYQRIPVANNGVNWSAATFASRVATKTSTAAFSFPASTAAWSSGATTCKSVFIADASTLAGGNVLAYGALTTAQAVNASGITLSFASGALTITLA